MAVGGTLGGAIGLAHCLLSRSGHISVEFLTAWGALGGILGSFCGLILASFGFGFHKSKIRLFAFVVSTFALVLLTAISITRTEPPILARGAPQVLATTSTTNPRTTSTTTTSTEIHSTTTTIKRSTQNQTGPQTVSATSTLQSSTHFLGTWSNAIRVAASSTSGIYPISCVSPTFCMAASAVFDESGHVTGENIYIFNGTNWRYNQELHSTLWWLSCTSTNWCMGGDDSGSVVPSIWSSGTWHTSGLPQNRVYPVNGSCPSSSFCMAGGANGTLMKWTPSGWGLAIDVFDISQSSSQIAPTVSCASSSFCMARDAPGGRATTEEYSVWNGATWSAPTDVQDKTGSTYSMSCGSPTLCVALSTFFTPNNETQDAASRWNGQRWVAQSMGGLGGGLVDPNSVSCKGSDFCMVVGPNGSPYEWLMSGWRSRPLKFARNTTPWVNCSSPKYCLVSYGSDDVIRWTNSQSS